MLKTAGIFLVVFLSTGCVLQAQSGFGPGAYPARVIFDTDFGPDYDDVGAITLLHGLADSGYVRILATMASCRHPHVAAAISVFNTYFGRADIPIGVVRGKAVTLGDKQHWTDSVIRRYPHGIQNNEAAEDALALYRKVLAVQPDQSVTIISVGFLTNLANLLVSGPDRDCPLNGYDLVKAKVRQLVSMAGRFPSGTEFNLVQDPGASTTVLTGWPTPILFSGFEIGQKIKTGLPLIRNDRIQNSPVKDVFALCIPFDPQDSAGRMSWDETAVFVAVKGWRDFYDIQTGHCTLHSDGSDSWQSGGDRQAHLLEKISPLSMQEIINTWLQHQPMVKNSGTKDDSSLQDSVSAGSTRTAL